MRRRISNLIPCDPEYRVDELGNVYGKSGMVMRPSIASNGYKVVALQDSGKERMITVHSIVASTFLVKSESDTVVRHFDGNKMNVAASNLRWGTHSDNLLDEVRLGTHPMASKTHCKRGHEFTVENTYMSKKGSRVCRTCRAGHIRDHQARKHARVE